MPRTATRSRRIRRNRHPRPLLPISPPVQATIAAALVPSVGNNTVIIFMTSAVAKHTASTAGIRNYTQGFNCVAVLDTPDNPVRFAAIASGHVWNSGDVIGWDAKPDFMEQAELPIATGVRATCTVS